MLGIGALSLDKEYFLEILKEWNLNANAGYVNHASIRSIKGHLKYFDKRLNPNVIIDEPMINDRIAREMRKLIRRYTLLKSEGLCCVDELYKLLVEWMH